MSLKGEKKFWEWVRERESERESKRLCTKEGGVGLAPDWHLKGGIISHVCLPLELKDQKCISFTVIYHIISMLSLVGYLFAWNVWAETLCWANMSSQVGSILSLYTHHFIILILWHVKFLQMSEKLKCLNNH